MGASRSFEPDVSASCRGTATGSGPSPSIPSSSSPWEKTPGRIPAGPSSPARPEAQSETSCMESDAAIVDAVKRSGSQRAVSDAPSVGLGAGIGRITDASWASGGATDRIRLAEASERWPARGRGNRSAARAMRPQLPLATLERMKRSNKAPTRFTRMRSTFPPRNNLRALAVPHVAKLSARRLTLLHEA